MVCSALKETGEKADHELVALNPQRLPAAINQGFAPAMKVDIKRPCWGGEPNHEDTLELRELCGFKPEREVAKPMRKVFCKVHVGVTAREVMQQVFRDDGREELPLPKWTRTKRPPQKPTAYRDGSLETPGAEPWWPGPNFEDRLGTEAEMNYLEASKVSRASLALDTTMPRKCPERDCALGTWRPRNCSERDRALDTEASKVYRASLAVDTSRPRKCPERDRALDTSRLPKCPERAWLWTPRGLESVQNETALWTHRGFESGRPQTNVL